MKAAGAEGSTMRQIDRRHPEWPGFACGLGVQRLLSPEVRRRHAFPLTGDWPRSRVSGAAGA